MRRPNCTHSEGHLFDANGQPATVVNAHDCDYVDARNALIPTAMRMATQAVGVERRSSGEWSRQFLAAMDELARKCGMVSPVQLLH